MRTLLTCLRTRQVAPKHRYVAIIEQTGEL
jgi:hypothetical protein